METEDPRAGLEATDVPTRSAAARDLARVGTWGDLAVLVKHAMEDKSPAVRLYSAAAGADIVARRRGAAGQTAMTAAEREQVIGWVKAIDPGNNPGLLMMLSAVADEAAIDRLGRMLRDPRNGVRAGAAAALRRMALSGAWEAAPSLKESVGGWLKGGKLPLDSNLELIRMVGEVGWRGFEATLRQMIVLGKLHAAAVEEVGVRLKKRDDPASWEGLWIADGLDVLELGDPKDRRWTAIHDGQWAQSGSSAALKVEAGVGKAGKESVRMIWAPKVGEPEVRLAAVQRAGATWWRQEGKDLAAAVDEWIPAFTDADRDMLRAVGRWLETVDGTLATRARGMVAWRSGDPETALKLFEELATHKKPRPDVYYWLGRVLADVGRREDAIRELESFLEKVAKRAEFRKEAEDLLKKLG